MSKADTYSGEDIRKICDEIERQWEYLLVTRAAFPVDAVQALPKYPSRNYYRHYGAKLSVAFEDPESPLIRRALQGIPQWSNQNFIIRLFGLLDEYMVITAGKEANNEFTEIVARLRHLVGAHTSGNPRPQRTEFRKVTGLIKSHLAPSIDLDSVRNFALDIKTVVRPLKEKCKEFVRTLEGKRKPEKKPGGCAAENSPSDPLQ